MYKHLEALGYPRLNLDWFGRRRLVTIAILAALSWAALMLLFLGLSYLQGELVDLVRDLLQEPVGDRA